jgi:bacterioferritin-associated ferredoxin
VILKVIFIKSASRSTLTPPDKAAVIVCHCQRISHRRVLEVVQQGARTPAEVGRACGAGTCCGGCVKTICELIDEGTAEEAEPVMMTLTEEFAYA